jgi:hypothetical protein
MRIVAMEAMHGVELSPALVVSLVRLDKKMQFATRNILPGAQVLDI